jgi:RHS repeat-associated protein
VPQSITAGQTAVLTLSAPANQPVSANNSLSIAAAATVNGIPVSQSTPVSLAVTVPTTALLGRTTAADNMQTPLAGVTITSVGQTGNLNQNGSVETTGCTGQTTTSDGAGNFAFTNLPTACTGPQLFSFNGNTVTSPAGKYAGVQLVFTIVQGQVTVSPINVHLPQVNNAETFYVQQNASTDQTYSYTTIPGLKVTVYAGTTITMADGSQPNPYPLAAIQVPADRLPDVKPQVPTMMMALIVAFQPENSTASQPIAVYYPNALNTPPGTDSMLITLDPERGTMVPYGTGAVAPNGTDVIPDADPAHPGHLYGLTRPGWHFFAPPPPPPPPPPPDDPPDDCPVDGGVIYIPSGLDIVQHTDIEMDGTPLSLRLVRAQYTDTSFIGPFGIGGDHNFDYAIDSGSSSTAVMFNLVLPFGARRVPFVRQTNGTLVNSADPAYAGAVFTTASDNSSALRLKNGVTYQFSPGGFLISIDDPNGNSIDISRDQFNEVTLISDSLGRQLTFNYAVAHPPLIGSIVDSTGRTVSYTYDSSYRILTYTDTNGGVWQYAYDPASGNLSTVTDPRGVVVQKSTFDGNGRVISQLQADGSTLQFAYTYYNPTVPANSPILTTTETDQLGRQRVYRFNAQGYLIQVTDPMGQVRNFNRAAGTNLLLSLTGPGTCKVCGDPTSGDVTYTYDASGNQLSQSDSLGDTYNYTYDPVFNQVTSVTDPTGALTQYQRDSHGNLTGITDSLGNQTTIAAGPYGLPAQVTDPANQTTTLQYDAYGNLVGIQDALGETTTIAYDELFRPTEVTDASGAQYFRTWDLLSRLTRQTDGNGGITVFTYDPVGNLLTAADPRGSQTSWTYDSLSRVIKRSDGLGRQETFGYDALSNLTSHTDRRGQTSQFNYDSLNRLTIETYPDASVSRTYDANSRLIQASDSQSGVLAFQYDPAGRLLNSVSPVGAITYVRDGLGRMVSRQATGMSKVTYQYDPAGNLTQAALSQATVNLAYDVRNLLSTVIRSNGVTSAVTRDALARVLSIAHQAGSNVLASFSYGYDPAGNRSNATATLAQALTTQATTGTFNLANEMSAFGGQSFTYDANGNRLTENGPGGTASYTWDGRNRLQSIAQPGGVATQFTYDFGGNLIQQSSTASSATSTTSYLLDQVTNVVEILTPGSAPVSLLTGVAPDTHLATVNAAGQAEFALHDAVASVAANSVTSAALAGTNLFEPFGQTTSTGASFPFAFTGRPLFAGSSVYYYRSRYFDPAAGRFLSEDTRGPLAGDLNLYRYLNNSPLSSADPFGFSYARGLFGGLNGWWTKHLVNAPDTGYSPDLFGGPDGFAGLDGFAGTGKHTGYGPDMGGLGAAWDLLMPHPGTAKSRGIQ